jgi:hypothetical protein
VFSLGEWCALLTVSMLPFFGLNLHAAIPTGSWGLWPPFPRGGFAPPPFPSPFHPFRPFYLHVEMYISVVCLFVFSLFWLLLFVVVLLVWFGTDSTL